MRWSDAGIFHPDYSVFTDLPFLDVEAELARSTRAGGRMLGARMRRDDRASADLAQGVFGGVDPQAIPPGPIRIRIPLRIFD